MGGGTLPSTHRDVYATQRVQIGKGPLCGGSAETPNSLCSKGLALHIYPLVKRRGSEEARKHYSFLGAGKEELWETKANHNGKPQEKNKWKKRQVKLARSEETGLNG